MTECKIRGFRSGGFAETPCFSRGKTLFDEVMPQNPQRRADRHEADKNHSLRSNVRNQIFFHKELHKSLQQYASLPE
jgi:hypothetical protein